jgi:hypothetical protein
MAGVTDNMMINKDIHKSKDLRAHMYNLLWNNVSLHQNMFIQILVLPFFVAHSHKMRY